MGCASSSDTDAGQQKSAKSVYDVTGQQLSTLPPPQSTVAPKSVVATDNLLSRLPDFSSSKVWVAVERVDFQRNRFTRIPAQLESLPKLTTIDFSSNPFAKSGAFDGLLKLTRLTTVTLRDVGMKNLPASLLSCRTISTLDLSLNPSLVLSGKGAPALEKMVQLRALILRQCQLAGELPQALRNSKLTKLDLSGNPKLDLSEPKSWGLLKKTLHELIIEDLALFGLPRGVCSCTAVRHLSLKGNSTLESLSGLIFMTELTELDLSDCSLKSLPAELDTAERLINLNLSGNRLAADPTIPINWWRWPVNASIVQISVLASLSAIDLRSAAATVPDPQLINALLSCKDTVEISMSSGPSRNVLPLALATNLLRLASFNELPVPDATDARDRVAKICAVTNSEEQVTVLPSGFAAVQHGTPIRNFVEWLSAIHNARTALGLMWPIAVTRFRVFEEMDALRPASPRRRGPAEGGVGASNNANNNSSSAGDVPLDVAAVHLGMHLQALLEPGSIVVGAPYLCTQAPPASASEAGTSVWDSLVGQGGQLPSAMTPHDLLGSHNPLEGALETPETNPAEDHARELVLRFAAHVVEAMERGLILDGAETQYVRLLALTVSGTRYLPLNAQIAGIAHFSMDPALFASDVGPLFPDAGGVDIPQKLLARGTQFEISDGALGRTSAAWDAQYKEHCPWLSAVAKGCTASPELFM